MPETPWWKTFFTDLYARVGLGARSPEEAEDVADFLIAVLRVAPGDLLFDQCCGVGRLSRPLADRGVRVIGVDQSPEYVEQAVAATADCEAACSFRAADAFEFVPDQPCDGAFNWFTSFGYSDSDEMNLGMLRRAWEALQPGGRFALDLPNLPALLANFSTCNVERLSDGTLVIQEVDTDLRRGTFETTFTIVLPDSTRQVHRAAPRMFMPHELCRLVAGAGFQDLSLYGGLDGSDLTLSSERCIIVGQKPG